MAEPNHRKVYAKGYYDGLNAASLKNDNKHPQENTSMMSRARFNAIFNGMTSIAKKTYEAVPIAESWTAKQIVSEMQRNGVTADYRIICGSLNSLINCGVVSETSKGAFNRIPIKEVVVTTKIEAKPATIIATPEVNMTTVTTMPQQRKTTEPQLVKPASNKTPVDRMGELSAKLSAFADSIKLLAEEINDTAIAIEEDIEASAISIAKMNQLKTLLQSI